MIRTLVGLVAALAGAAPALPVLAQDGEDVDPAWAAEMEASWLEACTEKGPETLHLWARREAGPGARVSVVPHDGRDPLLHPACLAELAVSPDGAGEVLDDGRTVLISRDAAIGSVITVSARVGDDRLTHEIRVLPPDPRPLDGRWTQVEALCPGRSLEHIPLRELEIRDGWFGATFHPLESYRDFSGDAVWAPESSTLEFRVTSQNARWEMRGGPGTAYLTPDDRLVLDGFMFGHILFGHALESDCRYVFRRMAGE